MKYTVVERFLDQEDVDGNLSYGLKVEEKSFSYLVEDVSSNKDIVGTIARLCELAQPSREKLMEIIEAIIP